jgi:hypothetical protein
MGLYWFRFGTRPCDSMPRMTVGLVNHVGHNKTLTLLTLTSLLLSLKLTPFWLSSATWTPKLSRPDSGRPSAGGLLLNRVRRHSGDKWHAKRQ